MNNSKNQILGLYYKSNKKSTSKDFYFPALAKNSTTFNLPQDESLIDYVKQQEHLNSSQIQQPIMKRHFSQIKNSNKKYSLPKNPEDKLNISSQYFTKRTKQQFYKRSIELKDKKESLMNELLTKRDEFQDFKMKKQKIKDDQKHQLLSDIQFKKQQRQREHLLSNQKNKQVKMFVHTCNLDKIDMEKRLKAQTRQEQLMLAKQKYLETEHHSSFMRKEYLKGRNHHMKLLESRLMFLMSEKLNDQDHQGFLNRKMTSRSFYGTSPSKIKESY